MIIDSVINVRDDRISSGLVPMVDIMSKIESSTGQDIIIDFSNCQFISPLFALSLIVYLSRCGKNISMRQTNSYLNTIYLPEEGIKPDSIRRSEFVAIMEGYRSKSFIPIINFPAQANNDDKDTILSIVEDMIIRQAGIHRNVANGIRYIIGETIDNITEHSETDRGYIFAQGYPKKGYLDICIADRGISLLGSYSKLTNNGIESDIEAIQAANRGLSTKNLPKAENRGYGIITSKRMLVEGLGGQYLMLSGGSFYAKSPQYDRFFSMPSGLRWNGTIIALRIPCQVSTFDYINYIE